MKYTKMILLLSCITTSLIQCANNPQTDPFEKQLETMVLHNITQMNSPLAATSGVILFYALNIKERIQEHNKLNEHSKRAFSKFIESAVWANLLNCILPRITQGQPRNGWAYLCAYATTHAGIKVLKPYLKKMFNKQKEETAKPDDNNIIEEPLDITHEHTPQEKTRFERLPKNIQYGVQLTAWAIPALIAYAITPF